MRLLVVSAYFPPAWSWGGQASAAWTLCRGLARAGADVEVVTTDADMEGWVEVPRRRREAGMTIYTARVPRPSGGVGRRYGLAPGCVATLWRRTRGPELALLQGMWSLPCAVAARICRWRALPYVICPHGMLESLSLSEKAGKKRLYLRLFGRRAVAGAAAIQFASEDERRRSAAVSGAVPSFVEANTIEFHPLVAVDSGELRERLGLPRAGRLVGIAGRLHPRKGFDVIVPALAQAPDEIRLVSFGADEAAYRRKIVELARAHGVEARVQFLGQLEGEALQQAYAALDLLVMPSHGESFGNTALEALAQGTPALVSDRVPLGEYISRHGLGAVVDGLDPRAWGRAVEREARRREAAERRRISERVRADFDVELAGRRLLERYRRLTESR
ncbi:MAG TPA: glycosyltransferase [Candidatus Polarisedimenticolaceae bacterium]|nr:glycosyltransferase [Candidatus Polarisedimenticolaceae bacterium]